MSLILLATFYWTIVVGMDDQQFLPITYEFIRYLRNESLYNHYATPTQYQEMATNVSMSMYIEGMSSFSARTMDYHLDMYFQQQWLDSRLAHSEGNPMLVRDRGIFKLIWHPDIYFSNARTATFQDVTDENFLVWIYPTGKIFYDCRISLSVICTMDLSNYPLDGQQCEMRIMSYAYPESQMKLQWTDAFKAIDSNRDIKMPDMALIDIQPGRCNGTYNTGIWSCVTANFIVQRKILHHIVQTYIPTALIVVISWFNFWLDIDSAPARVSLSITTLLTISTQANAVKLSLPEVAYMKAIDIWMGVCMAFIFGVMIEFTICHYARNQREKMPHVTDLSSLLYGPTNSIDESMNAQLAHLDGTLTNHNASKSSGIRKLNNSLNAHQFRDRMSSLFSRTLRTRRLRGLKAANDIDKKCRYLFPLVFLCFNLVYWTFYLFIIE